MKYKLDYSKWICGTPNINRPAGGIHSLGEGGTALLNREGYMCCLGQFSEQHGVSKKGLLCRGEPLELGVVIDPLTEKDDVAQINNTPLSSEAMFINDDADTTIAEKVVRLRELFREGGHEIELVNFPAPILEEVKKKEDEDD